ncbi:MAG TPA: hypothetical protein VJU82_12025 [Acidobacteriaceae bacterium]|nr:hypothetical protein [Acidobacteriaceae bacterium]
MSGIGDPWEVKDAIALLLVGQLPDREEKMFWKNDDIETLVSAAGHTPPG